MTGIIIKSIAGFLYVEAGNMVYECKPRGIFRKNNISPLVGDIVEFTIDGEKGVVEEIKERKNSLIRPPIANIDKLFIVSSLKVPDVNTLLIDRMTAIAEFLNMTPVIVFNKSDLGSFGDIPEIYRNIGYKTIVTSAETGEGIDEILQELKGFVSAFSGNSGVGKSSLLNKLFPKLNLNVGDVSQKLGRGRHTTRHVELYRYEDGYVADTPGFSSLELTDFLINNKDDLKFCFPEFKEHFGCCRFSSCSHTNEPDCSVINGISCNKISKSRHDNYCLLYNELKKIKSWEINKK